MVSGRSRRKFLGTVGAAALGLGLTGDSRAGVLGGAQDSRKAGALQPFGFVIHGGAGSIERSRMTPERE